MNYLKKIYLNWFVLGCTFGLIPYVVRLISDAEVVTVGPFIYLLILVIPAITVLGVRKLYDEAE